MQKKKLFSSVLLAAAAIGLALSSATAASLSYSKDDLILAFRSTTSNSTYLVNIGSGSIYRNATAAFTLNIGSTAADLSSSALFGSSWAAAGSNVLWSVSGTNYSVSGSVNGDPFRTIYVTKGESPFGTVQEPWTIGSSNNQAIPSSNIDAMSRAYASTAGVANTSTANSSVGYIQNNNAVNSYQSSVDGTAAYGSYPGGIEGSFASGAAFTAIDLYRLQPTASGDGRSPGDPGTYEGRFTISSLGVITFTPAAVPEPSTVALLIVAFGVIGFFVRRGHRSARA